MVKDKKKKKRWPKTKKKTNKPAPKRKDRRKECSAPQRIHFKTSGSRWLGTCYSATRTSPECSLVHSSKFGSLVLSLVLSVQFVSLIVSPFQFSSVQSVSLIVSPFQFSSALGSIWRQRLLPLSFLIFAQFLHFCSTPWVRSVWWSYEEISRQKKES